MAGRRGRLLRGKLGGHPRRDEPPPPPAQEVHGDERADKVERSIDLIRDAIGAGAGHLASTDEVEDLIESVQAPDPDDRHVVAAALAVEANCIVTHNLTDFDAEWCAERGIGLLGLDDFLAELVGVCKNRHFVQAADGI